MKIHAWQRGRQARRDVAETQAQRAKREHKLKSDIESRRRRTVERERETVVDAVAVALAEREAALLARCVDITLLQSVFILPYLTKQW